ncbi:hypothetical protein DP114_15635 [Brasilonema sennae CENA114]|uniref:NACHT domain-containing protein n=1 Tax=Brasilonema sennae CENA114 TaxID=415709 RepID=A0A856MHN2_9CYAN|nr:HEAT repeat domain-containing protein [Brasilonema sennae]QDL09141.1 hypothetical protein DP114_15635 [Brasilonema sennae CENA114]
MPEDAGKFAEKIGVYAQNSIVNIHNQNIGVSDDSGATPINWHEICRQLLESQRRLTSNPLMQDESAKLQREQIYVPLALVQRTKPEKRDKDDVSPEEGTRLYEPQYEEKQRFEHEAFLTQILEKAEGKTKGKHIALIGEAGAGKTTLLQSIAFWVLEKNLGFSIWISLADLGRSGTLTDLQSYLFNNWLSFAVPPTQLTQAKEELTTQIQQGRVWLLLDGVDEVAVFGVQTLQAIAQQLTGWIAQSRVVLTCRLNVWQADYNALETFETYRLLDFDYPKQVHEFIDNWFGNLTSQRNLTPQPPLLIKERGSDKSEGRGSDKSEERGSDKSEERKSKAERLKAELDNAERGRLRDLVQNPLRLTLLCSIWQSEEGNLPQTKAGLYQQFVQQIYTWKKNRFPISTEEQQKLNNALGRLALRDIQEGGSRFRLLESFIKEQLDDPDDEKSSFYKALQLGWLNHVGIAAESQSQEKVYAFFHATFEEYFAALTIDDWDFFLPREHKNKPVKDKDTGKPKPYQIFEPQWKEVILLWLGRENLDLESQKKEEFIKALVEFNDGCGQFYQYRAYFLAAMGIVEFGDCSKADDIVEQIVKWGFGYFNTQTKQWQTFADPVEEGANTALQQTHRAKAIAALVKLINTSQDEDTRRDAAYSLGKIAVGNESAIAALVKLIDTSQDEYTRWLVADSLGKIAVGNESAIAALVKLIDTSQDEFTRRQAAESLEKILTTDQMAKVVTALRDNSKPNKERYKVIWHCAQNMSYSDFYQAWHPRSNMKSAMRSAQYRWWQVALYLFLGLCIFALVRFTVSPSVNNPANIQRQQ